MLRDIVTLTFLVVAFATCPLVRSSSLSPVYKGCYKDVLHDRDMIAKAYMPRPMMLLDDCLLACHHQGFLYAAAQYSTECYCGNMYGKHGRALSESECNFVCRGNITQQCGGLGVNSVWQLGTTYTYVVSSSVTASSTTSTITTKKQTKQRAMLATSSSPLMATIDATSSTIRSAWFSMVDFTLAEWSICVWMNKSLSETVHNSSSELWMRRERTQQVQQVLLALKLFEIHESDTYTNGWLFASKKRTDDAWIEVNVLTPARIVKHTIEMTLTAMHRQLVRQLHEPSARLVLVWRRPSLVAYINCQRAGELTLNDEAQKSDSNSWSPSALSILSLPYVKPLALQIDNATTAFFATKKAAMTHCANSDTMFVNAITIPAPSATAVSSKSPKTPSTASSSNNNDDDDNEWSYAFRRLTGATLPAMMASLRRRAGIIRLFEFATRNDPNNLRVTIYFVSNGNINNGMAQNNTIRVDVMHSGGLWKRHEMALTTQPMGRETRAQNKNDLQSMLVSWLRPNIVIHVNCKYVGIVSLLAANNNTSNTPTFPTFSVSRLRLTSSAIVERREFSARFFSTISDALLKSDCLNAHTMVRAVARQSATPSLSDSQSATEWSVLFSWPITSRRVDEELHVDERAAASTAVRLLDVYSADYSQSLSVDYVPTTSHLVVNMLNSNDLKQLVFAVPSPSGRRLYAANENTNTSRSLIVAWHHGMFSVLVDCRSASRVDYIEEKGIVSDNGHASATKCSIMSLPALPTSRLIMHTSGIFYTTLKEALVDVRARCVDARFEYPVIVQQQQQQHQQQGQQTQPSTLPQAPEASDAENVDEDIFDLATSVKTYLLNALRRVEQLMQHRQRLSQRQRLKH